MGVPVTLRARAPLLVGLCLLLLGGVPAAAQEPGGPVDADRVVVRFVSGTFELLSVNPLSTVLPASDEPPAGESLSGFWYELQGSDGSVRYRRIIGDPVRLVFEGPSMDPALAPQARRVLQSESPRIEAAPVERADRSGREVDRGVRRERRSVGSVAERDTQGARRAARLSAQEHPVAERDEAIPAERVFTVVIPRAQQGDVLVLFSSPLEAGAGAQAASEVGRLPLAEGNEGGAS